MSETTPFRRLGEGAAPDRPSGIPAHAAAFGLPVSDSTDWKPVLDLYYGDRVQEAFDRAQEVGLGVAGGFLSWYRLIEAEAVTRSRAQFLSPAPWLEVEFVPGEIERAAIEPIGLLALQVCERVASRLEFDRSAPTLISFLAAETDAPWTPGRDGMCMDKRPYAKITVPARVLADRDLLRRVLAHEFAHVVVIHAAQGNAPTWLSEAVALSMEDERPRQARRPARWRAPRPLDDAFRADRRDLAGAQGVADAYAQSAILGRTLVDIAGDAGLADLLRRLGGLGWWQRLAVGAGLADPTDVALRRSHGFTAAELFARSAR